MADSNTVASKTPTRDTRGNRMLWVSRRVDDGSDCETASRSPVGLNLAGESTPMSSSQSQANRGPDDNTSFLSPLRKLDQLNLDSQIDFGSKESTSASEEDIGSDQGIAKGYKGTRKHNRRYRLTKGKRDSPSRQSVSSPASESGTLERSSSTSSDNEFGSNFGNQTIVNDSGSENDGYEDEDSVSSLETSPRFIKNRKRQLESPSDVDMVITPVADNKSDHHRRSYPSIPSTTSASASFKLSFSTSDSTPCPIQPRKRLKFKRSRPLEDTPSSTKLAPFKKTLNVNNYVKTKTETIPILQALNGISGSAQKEEASFSSSENEHEEDHFKDEHLHGNSMGSSPDGVSTFNTSYTRESVKNAEYQSTPISQSTPANSRPSTPAQHPQSFAETEDSVNGYKFVNPVKKPNPYYSYQTPENGQPSMSQNMKYFYHRNDSIPMPKVSLQNGKYEIVGDLPITSAGIMNESNEDLHVGDKRINDPYLNNSDYYYSIRKSSSSQDKIRVRQMYFDSFDKAGSDLQKLKLPLLSNFQGNEDLSRSKAIQLISDGYSVMNFYKYIQHSNEELVDLLKKERVKWHPDKWHSRLKDSNLKDRVLVNKDIVDRLSQVLNSIIEHYMH
ncbi:Piso0_001385 [Millerozyma farinosa CBS 7064]|uniref:Piso0_001385 protein n=1 Tax=Pichia sorbitophila (strain ATCC MYA-4447 / BCRC 22081 / CBS 7064 / NBRC 10061 / NRRL Y-12695) TaxID=559304 RepID=G8YN10_PICSO|nr:Piso0_001385 [Millerozyma farinosa CBS 7064]